MKRRLSWDSAEISEQARLDAARWLQRRESGLTERQEAEFAEWLTADDGHARAFAEAEDTWNRLDALSSLRTSDQPDLEALTPLNEKASADTCPPARVVSGRPAWSVWLPVALGLAAALVVGYLGGWRTPASFHERVETAVGGLDTLNLPDGSVVHLNTDTALEVIFTPSERRVHLQRGEAHFTVARSAERPFVVSAGRVAVRAVGTAFNVRFAQSAVEVLVTEGRVRLDDSAAGGSLLPAVSPASTQGAETPLLVAGERAVVPLAGAASSPVVAVLGVSDVERSLAWRERRLEFASTPLAEVVAEFNRYNTRRLIIDDPKLAELRFGGVFRADASDMVVRMLETNFNVVAERQDDRTLLRLAPPAP